MANTPFKMKSSPTKLFWGKKRKAKREEKREEKRRKERRQDELVRGRKGF